MTVKTKRTRRIAQSVTPAQRRSRFIAEYVKDLNATKAALRCGVPKGSAHSTGWELKHELAAEIEAALAKINAEALKKAAVTTERIVAELAKIGFSDIRGLVRWKTKPITKTRSRKVNGSDITTSSASHQTEIELLDSDEIDDDMAAAISEVSMGLHGPRVKLHDKRAALVDLGRHTGAFKEDAAQTVPVRFVIEWANKPETEATP
jgi:phage terminase small subunit